MPHATKVLKIARNLNIPVVDMRYHFANIPNASEMFLCDHCHYSIKGYFETATAIADAVDEELTHWASRSDFDPIFLGFIWALTNYIFTVFIFFDPGQKVTT